MAQNYAEEYAGKIDEKWTAASMVSQIMNTNGFEWNPGYRTINIYHVPTVPLSNYTRSGKDRYGPTTELGTTLQELTVGVDRAFSISIDRGNQMESKNAENAGDALARELKERVVPEQDYYVLSSIAKAAVKNGNYDTNSITTDNAYSKLLAAHEAMGDVEVPDSGLICYCSYKFYGKLLQDDNIVMQTPKGQEARINGIMGVVDGISIVRIPQGRFPHTKQMTKDANGLERWTSDPSSHTGDFILVHKEALVVPKRLMETRLHKNPPGLSGTLLEGRFIWDCFTLNNKAAGIFYQGANASSITVAPKPRRGGQWNEYVEVAITTSIAGTGDTYGKAVSDLQSGVTIAGGRISGVLNYVTGYTGFSGDSSEQSGNYLALKFVPEVEGTQVSVQLIGQSGRVAILESDGVCVFRIRKDPREIMLKVTSAKDGYDSHTEVYSLDGLHLQSAT